MCVFVNYSKIKTQSYKAAAALPMKLYLFQTHYLRVSVLFFSVMIARSVEKVKTCSATLPLKLIIACIQVEPCEQSSCSRVAAKLILQTSCTV